MEATATRRGKGGEDVCKTGVLRYISNQGGGKVTGDFPQSLAILHSRFFFR